MPAKSLKTLLIPNLLNAAHFGSCGDDAKAALLTECSSRADLDAWADGLGVAKPLPHLIEFGQFEFGSNFLTAVSLSGDSHDFPFG